jgi:hypothetical protein
MTTRSVGNTPNLFAAQLQNGLDAAQRQLVRAAVNTVTALTKLATQQLDQLAKSLGAGATNGAAPATGAAPTTGAAPATGTQAPGASEFLQKEYNSLADVFDLVINGCPTPPAPIDASPPPGSLKTDANGCITTPGGYKIEATGQFEWKVTGPDGKNTRVWGDPHVAEGDGGTWDFKRDSTFVLGDGTRLNVTTAPWGDAGATVTKGLEVISGNDRVQISDIDKGKGKTGTVTQDGFAHANSFGGKDVFVMGKETDDWSFQGKEVLGSNNGGESFKLGGDLAVGNPTTQPAQTPAGQPTTQPAGQPTTQPANNLTKLLDLFKGLTKVLQGLQNLSQLLGQRANQNTGIVPPGREPVENRRRGALERAFANIGRMLDTVMKFQNLSKSINANRTSVLA